MGQIALSSLMAKSSGSISLGIALAKGPFCQPPKSLESNNIIACHPLGQSLFV